ncbi:MAG: hypothetical protein KAU35_04185 [candidate division Zixibacteria bacterium]|nr:hypothetical protein [candidate division Zixibacteria bacterium]
MDFTGLFKLVFVGLKPVLENHAGLGVLVSERARFEGWLKVEFCRVLTQQGIQPETESSRYDVVFDKWAVELRTVTTNLRHDHVRNVKLSTRKNVETLIKDIWKLTNPGRSVGFSHRVILFVVFPMTPDDDNWQDNHLGQISSELIRLEAMSFQFAGGIPGMLYLGLCTGE